VTTLNVVLPSAVRCDSMRYCCNSSEHGCSLYNIIWSGASDDGDTARQPCEPRRWNDRLTELNPVYTIQPVVKPVWQPVAQQAVSCIQTSNRLSNRLYNRLFNCTAGWTTALTTGCIVYTNIERVVKPVWQPVWQQVVSCKRGFTFYVPRDTK